MNLVPVLADITALIVRSCDPDEILLFGSHAKGTNNEDSDLDLLVVGRFVESPRLRGLALRELMGRYAIPVDIHFVTRDELAAQALDGFGFHASVLKGALSVYARARGFIDKPRPMSRE